MSESTLKERTLEARITQLKQDLGHSRNNGYVVTNIRKAIDDMLAEAEMETWLEGCEPAEVTILRHLQKIAYADNADMFDKGK